MTQEPLVSPGALAVDSEAHRVYAAHARTGTITVVDGTTLTVSSRTQGPQNKGDVVANASTGNVFVADSDSVAVLTPVQTPQAGEDRELPEPLPPTGGDVTPVIVLAAVLVCGGIVARRAAARHRPRHAKETP